MKKEKIRIALFMNSYSVPRWQYEILKQIKESDYSEVSLVILNNNPETRNKVRKYLSNLKFALFILYTKFDKWLLKKNKCPFDLHNSEELLSSYNTIKVTPRTRGFSDYFEDSDVNLIKEHNIDIGFRMGFKIIRGDILNSTKFGIWSYHHGDNKVNRGGPPAFWEVMRKDSVTGAILQILTDDLDNGIIIGRVYNSTDKVSYYRNKVSLYQNSKFLFMKKVKELYVNQEIPKYDEPTNYYSFPIFRKPKNSTFLRYIIKHISFIAARKLNNFLYFNQWVLMVASLKKQNSIHKYSPIIPPRDRFWADPFLYENNGITYVFFEELIYKEGKGHISVAILEKNKLIEPQQIINETHHLSYPFLIEESGILYMIPESSGGNKTTIYKCVDFPYKWEAIETIFNGEKLYDITIIYKDELWWLFANKISYSGESSWNHLHIYYSESLIGDNWKPHSLNPVKSDTRSSRPAGKIISHNNELLRPSQDCSSSYGGGIVINKILKLTPDEYSEIIIDNIEPNWSNKYTGLHTINQSRKYSIIDAKYRRFKL